MSNWKNLKRDVILVVLNLVSDLLLWFLLLYDSILCQHSSFVLFQVIILVVICASTSTFALSVCHCTLCAGSLQSLDWTGGLDWWTGLVD